MLACGSTARPAAYAGLSHSGSVVLGRASSRGPFLLPLLDVAAGLAILVLLALGYSWLAWRAAGRWAPWVLAPMALAATLICAVLQALRLHRLAMVDGDPARPGVMLTNVLVISILYGAGFVGASVALWKRWKTLPRPTKPPLKAGLKGFFLGTALPLLFALGRGFWLFIRP